MSLIFFILFTSPFYAQNSTITLSPGDNLFRITLKTGIPSQVLMRVNQISDETRLRSGQVLKIPSIHVVNPGETLFALSRRWGVTVDLLKTWNDLNTRGLVSGQKLYYLSEFPGNSGTPVGPDSKPVPGRETAPAPRAEQVKTAQVAQDSAYILPLPGRAEKITDPVSGIKFQPSDGAFLSASEGTVIFQETTRDLGKILLVEDPKGRIFGYCGFDSSALVLGGTVSKGQPLGQVKKNGSGLMFFLYENGKPAVIQGDNP